ncbi:BatA domain-containing protein [Arcticibacterium luteifluviistationis]|uniref:Aerotolerance regulator N-terminal domain-containing protein n=1 Tax=Arcticibacterium luteifluviistationis TaxID=1784714 RepID=A0A2Z4GIA5_9BACT|nr:BatA domain-containing protein [Arcticibacterium luteifluviistationis]AWW00696.1 hypothetical protein DJ013_21905 [Arcticibacterium luteifluviistationis]
MQFLNPGLLWGLLVLAVPVIIHLFNFRRTKKVYFTNVAFLKKVETETSSFRKLKQWLIMAARMLFLAALVLAFAQPFFPAQNGLSANSTAKGINSLYLDNSLSMQNTTDNKRFIDLAVVKVDELLALFKNQQNIQLTTNDFSGEDQFANSATKVRDRLTGVRFSPEARNLSSVYKRQVRMAEKEASKEGNNFFWFSDFQKSTVGDLLNLETDSTNQVYLVPVQGEVSKNVFVDSVWLSSPFIREMQNSLLNVKVFNSGNEAIEKMPIKLMIDGVQTSTSSVSVSPESYATASFNFTVRSKGQHMGSVSFDDQPITFDNEQYFVVDVSPAINILHLFEQKSASDYIAKLYDDDSLFNFEQYNIRNVNLAKVGGADLVVVEGLNKIGENLKSSLIDFVKEGGSLFLIPGENPDLLTYQELVSSLGLNTLTAVRDSVSVSRQIELEVPDKNEPFFADVFEQSITSAVVNLPKAQATIAWTGLGDKLLSLKSGKAFLGKTDFGNGSLYLLASPLSMTYGNFAEHALFVPTLFKVAALSIKPQQLAYNFNAGTLVIPFADAPKNAVYSLKKGDFEILPIQQVRGNKLLLELPSSVDLSESQELESGFYELQVDGVKHSILGLNHDSKESRMGNYTPDELRTIFENQSNITVFDNIKDGDFISTFAEQNFGVQLWKYFLYAALAFLLIEVLLVRFMKG